MPSPSFTQPFAEAISELSPKLGKIVELGPEGRDTLMEASVIAHLMGRPSGQFLMFFLCNRYPDQYQPLEVLRRQPARTAAPTPQRFPLSAPSPDRSDRSDKKFA